MTAPKFTVSAYHGDEPFCFVSYSLNDSEVVFEELQRLCDDGFHVYYDEGIHPGHAWHDELAQAIEKCSLFVLFITRNSIESANCLRELNFALDKQKPVLAIHLEDVQLSSGLQLALGDRQAIVRSRFEEDAFRDRITSAVGTYLTRATSSEGSARAGPVTDSPSAKTVAHETGDRSAPRSKNAMWFTVAALTFVLGVALVGLYFFGQGQQRLQDYQAALEEMDALIAEDRFTDAYVIMQQLDPRNDPTRSEYAERIVVPGKFNVETEGVSVSFKPYGRDDVDWFEVGTAPFAEDALFPRGFLHFKLEREGHETREIVAVNPGPMFGNELYLANMRRPSTEGGTPVVQRGVRLSKPGIVQRGWVEVMASNQPHYMAGWSRNVVGFDLFADTPRFYVQRFEVANSEYQEFVDAGGYRNPTYWQGLTFKDGGNELSFEEAMARFVDQTGRPGPSTWSLSSYGEGEADLPVGGVSWYEAAAYARFRNLSLPTIYQWTRYALGPLEGLYPLAAEIEKTSNLNSTGLLPAATRTGLGPWGTYHTAGNVREWIWNQAGDLGLIQGSSWQLYGNYSTVHTVPQWDRHRTNGIRLVENDPDEPFDVTLLEPIDLVFDDPFVAREPVSDEVFTGMRFQFTAPRREPLDVRVERIGETALWTIDEHIITYSDEETFTLYLFKPSNLKPPYQIVMYGPPGDAVRSGQANRDAPSMQLRNFDYVLRAGRAVALPIWISTYERYRPIPYRDQEKLAEYRRATAVSLYRDAASTVNYLESLDDFATDKLAYMGYSYGSAYIGPIVVALEPRITTAIFVSGGVLVNRPIHPMMDGINYVPRITQPVLQLNGVYDHAFPYQESAVRHFELLGTPADQKRLVGYDASHIGFPENQLIAEITDWLDEQMGPVR